jgi:succinyl-CoA synthetase beta subunit
MEGNIGNVVNGAGLAMATNDAIAYHGGASANFLDAGGQATKNTIQKAFEIILRDTRVKVILVNIYGGKGELLHLNPKSVRADMLQALLNAI